MRTRTALIAAIWLAGVVLAAASVTAALVFLGSRVFATSGHALSQAQVRRELAERQSAGPAGPTPAAPGPSRAPSPAAAATTATAKTFSGGTVFASCSAGQVTVTQRIPAQGFEIDGVSPGPAATASVRFTSGSTEVLVTVTCPAGRPRFTSSVDDHHGGGHGGGKGSDG
jgi:hypothetical protein